LQRFGKTIAACELSFGVVGQTLLAVQCDFAPTKLDRQECLSY
jgi:hypothetical protein